MAAKLSALTLGIALAATHLRADVRTQTIQPQKIQKLWILIYLDGDGVETIAQSRTPSGVTFPLIAVDQGRLESIIALGKQVSAANKIKLTLVEFSHRSDVGEINP